MLIFSMQIITCANNKFLPLPFFDRNFFDFRIRINSNSFQSYAHHSLLFVLQLRRSSIETIFCATGREYSILRKKLYMSKLEILIWHSEKNRKSLLARVINAPSNLSTMCVFVKTNDEKKGRSINRLTRTRSRII